MARAGRSEFALDTSAIVAMVCSWHRAHRSVVEGIEAEFRAGRRPVVSAHALAETYAVLTRLPASHRLAPDDALRLIESNFGEGARTVALSAREYWTVLREAPERGVSGGQTYDALIAHAALKARVTSLLTLNPGHFAFAQSRGLAVVDLSVPPAPPGG